MQSQFTDKAQNALAQTTDESAADDPVRRPA